MMKNLFSKLKRKLGAVREQETHPDLEPQGRRVEQPTTIPRANAGKHAGRVATALAFGRQDPNDETLHPDLELIDPLVVEEFSLKNPLGEPPVKAAPAASKEGVSPADADTGAEAEHESRERQQPDQDAAPESPTPDVPAIADVLDAADLDYEEDAFAEEEDEFAELEEQFWEAELAFEVGGKSEYGGFDDAWLDHADFRELPELDPHEIHDEAESANWEELFELELYEEGADRSAPRIEEERISGDRQLDDYAARLVGQMQIIKLDERSRLHRRFKAILEEFPFSASYKALSSLISAGVSLEELEDACALKCLWREAPWLWSHRLFNRLLGAWETEERSTYRSALSWRLAISLIGSVGRPEAERKLFEDWLTEWQQMSVEHPGSGARMDPSFWSYSAYLQLKRERIPLIDDDLWFYEELPDRQLWNSLRIEDGDGEAWRFQPKSDRRDTGFLSGLPWRQRMVEHEEAERNEAQKQEEKANA